MKKFILIAIAAVALFTVWFYWKHPLSAKLKIKDQIFNVDVAVTPQQREQGLSGRKQLRPDQGMLFLFDAPGAYHFWMKDMLFPLDFIWINDKTIFDTNENVPPPKNGEPPVEIAPSHPVDKVLEVDAGTIKLLGIKIGDKVEFLNK